jgi:hypothetical protein
MMRLLKRLRRKSLRSPPQRGRRLRFEHAEDRLLMAASGTNPSSDWFDANLHDSGVRSLAQSDYQDDTISRSEMLGLYAEVETDGKVSAAERRDLITICQTRSGLDMADDVRDLANDVVGHSPANLHYQGHMLGNLKNGASSAKLEKLVDKWFCGEDLPAIDKFSHYETISGDLFVNGLSYTDVVQGQSGDCYLMSSLAELAIKDPTAIENMFIDNGDGTFAVRFYEHGVPRFVTVNDELPVSNFSGGPEYASFGMGSDTKELWVALIEKAYSEINEEGWTQHNGMNSYKGIGTGSTVEAIAEITGDSAGFTPIKSKSPGTMLNSIASDFQDGQAITFATKNHGTASNVVHDHSYAMIDYDAATQTATLYNPWGLNNGTSFPGLITLSWSEIVHSFVEWEVGDV